MARQTTFDIRKTLLRIIAPCVLFLFVVAAAIGNKSSAQITLYDNLDNVRSDGAFEDWQPGPGPDRRFAQQFLLGENTNIDQVTVLLLRPQPAVTGKLRYELWRDNGSGKPIPVDDPTGKISDLGTIVDVTQIPVGTFGEFTFDNLILGLEPNQPYWIVADHEEVEGLSSTRRSIGFAVVYSGDPQIPDPPGYDATSGTNGAAHFHAYRNQDPFWNNLNNVFRLDHYYIAMSVEARADSALIEIDALSSAVRQGITDGEYDINQDGQVDAGDREYWIKNMDGANTYFGDANLDGEFNSTDLTLVFQAGEYEDNITLNSSWSDGDWNGDGDFESGDLIVAFQDGGYELGPSAAVAVVPEPSGGWVLLTLGLIGIRRMRRKCLPPG